MSVDMIDYRRLLRGGCRCVSRRQAIADSGLSFRFLFRCDWRVLKGKNRSVTTGLRNASV